jgi:hypothetical protein
VEYYFSLTVPACVTMEGEKKSVGFTFENRVTNLTVLVSNLGPYVSSGGPQAHISLICDGGTSAWRGGSV